MVGVPFKLAVVYFACWFLNISGDAKEASYDTVQLMEQVSNAELSALKIVQKSFIVSIHSIDRTVTGKNLGNAVAEMFPPGSLFAREA